MFDFLKRNQAPSPRQIDKVVKRLTEPQGEDAPRVEAAEKLAEWGTPDALYGLLKRFTISSKNITQDIEEKRMVVQMLVDKGHEAADPILRFLSSHHNVEWPVRALSQILSQEELIPRLVEALEKVAAASAFTPPEHKSDLIRAMKGHVTPEIAAVLRQFLNDDDDDVRIAAIDAIADVAVAVNSSVENIGARRLQTVMERVLDDISFGATDRAGETVKIDAGYVERHIGDLAKNTDLSRFIL